MRKIFLTTVVAFGLLAAGVVPAYAASDFCQTAGHYEGKYDGQYDNGTVSADVNERTGVVTGEAYSARSGKTIPVAGVLDSSGAMTTAGVLGSGSVFEGHFLGDGEASGNWSQNVLLNGDTVKVGGAWALERKYVSQGCQ